jgi:heterodisulfide reductase subunit C2
MATPQPESHGEHGRTTLAETLHHLTGLVAARCYQCGKCSAGCPMAAETTLRPHDVMRLVNLDRADRLMADPSIWLCLTCETCTTRCPNGCDPARVMDALRKLGMESAPELIPRPVKAFHAAFLEQIQASGRMFELGLVLRYKLKTGALMQDAASTPALLARGKLKVMPPRIDGVADVRRIFAACSPAKREVGR